MQRKTLLASTLALLLAGSASLAMAQNDGPMPPPPSAGAPHGPGMKGPGGDHGDHHGPGGPGDMHGPEDMGVISDLHDLEHLYIMSGRAKELPALYNEVLSKSQDPRVRDFAYHQLARAQAQPTNVDASIATLRKSLDENLANEAKHHAEMEKMRAHWQQKTPDAGAK